MVTAVILWMLPVSEAVYDFRTELRVDEFSSTTGVGATSVNETLGKPIYDDDTGTIDILSDDSTDVPAFNIYASTSHSVNITGLTADTTRVLTVSYDVDALEGFDAINTFVDRIPFFWMLLIIIFPVAGIAYLFLRRGD